ncbi:MAG: FHA domain-containing protein [Anaerolineaceae bacterium]
MSSTLGLTLRVALFAFLYLFLFVALRLIWRSVTQKEPRGGSIPIPAIHLTSLSAFEGKSMTFTSAEVLIGRDRDCDFPISQQAISSRHGRLSFHQNHWWYEDLKSTNGSFLEDLRIEEPIVIKDGDRIYCGDVEISIKITPTY